jgi:AcrR family transcriptional regulator
MATHPQITFPVTEADRAGQLAAAAYDLLDEHGLEGLTIRAVLARTGLARRAFYECFAGKDDLVLAVFAQTLKAAAAYFRAAAGKLPRPLDRLRAIVEGIVLGMVHYEQAGFGQSERRSAALSREHLRLAESRPEELQKALSPLLDLIAEQVAAGIADGSIRQCDPALTASLIYNLISTTTHSVLLAEEDARPDEARREMLSNALWDFCRRAIAA